jgi:hypothetical protein
MKGLAAGGESAWESQRVSSSGPVTLAPVRGATQQAPADSATGINEQSSFSWMGGTSSVYLLTVTVGSSSPKNAFFCYTAGSSCTFPDLTAYPAWKSPASTAGTWSLAGLAPTTVNDVASRALMMGTVSLQSTTAADVRGFTSVSRTFTTP